MDQPTQDDGESSLIPFHLNRTKAMAKNFGFDARSYFSRTPMALNRLILALEDEKRRLVNAVNPEKKSAIVIRASSFCKAGYSNRVASFRSSIDCEHVLDKRGEEDA